MVIWHFSEKKGGRSKEKIQKNTILAKSRFFEPFLGGGQKFRNPQTII